MSDTVDGPARYRAAVLFDKNLKVGDTVQVRWTWGNGYYAAKAVISRLNDKSLRAKICHPVNYVGSGTLPTDHELVIPRITNVKWSWQNCVQGKSRWLIIDAKKIYQPLEVEAYSYTDATMEAIPQLLGQPLDQIRPDTLEDLKRDLVAKLQNDLW